MSIRRCLVSRWVANYPLVAIGIGGWTLLSASPAAAQKPREPVVKDVQPQFSDCMWNSVELPVSDPQLEVMSIGGLRGGGTDGSGCPQESVTLSNHPFNASCFVAQGGLVATEIAAVTYTVPAVNFPLRIDFVEGLFGTLNPQGQITTHWSLLVWEGEPNTGNLVYTITSDGKNPPHMVISPPTNLLLLQAGVDPNDPEQIIVTNNGSNKFSVGFRIDQHNSPATSPCSCFGGSLPAVCCPPPAGSNIFPTTDLLEYVNCTQASAANYTTQNWIWARACPGNTCFGGVLSGWFKFSQMGSSAPKGDWNIRATYTPTGCITPTGACCLPSGSCLSDQTSGQCSAQGGTYQGNNTTCGGVNCPIPNGACCFNNGTCSVQTFNDCGSMGGTYMGTGVQCGANLCRGACCIQSTQQCVNTFPNNCTGANVFHGFGSACANVACFGACCLPNGSCVGGISPANCSSQGGTFQGANSTCGQVNCPAPEGACCLGTDCLSNLTQVDCESGFGGAWQGALSDCKPNPCAPPPSCPSDIAPPTGDGVVNVNDLLSVINNWGPCGQPCPPHCNADITDDCAVNVNDLLAVINNWGPCE